MTPPKCRPGVPVGLSAGGGNSFFFRTPSGFPLRGRNTQDGRVRNEARPDRISSFRTVNELRAHGRLAATIYEYSQLSDVRGLPSRLPRLKGRTDRLPLDRRTSIASFSEKVGTENGTNRQIRVPKRLRADRNVFPTNSSELPTHLSLHILLEILDLQKKVRCSTSCRGSMTPKRRKESSHTVRGGQESRSIEKNR